MNEVKLIEYLKQMLYKIIEETDRTLASETGFVSGDQLMEGLSNINDLAVQALDEIDLQSDICPRCGAGSQATHHFLCQSRDGTPTPYSDDDVKMMLRGLNLGLNITRQSMTK